MLSRVAGRLYWMARYLERAENTARLLDVHHTLLLDLPADARIGWDPILNILGCHEAFLAEAPSHDAIAVQHFLIRDTENPSSLMSALKGARENARTSRDLIPTEAWRAINELKLFAQQQFAEETSWNRHNALTQVITRCQTISGLLAGTMSQGPAYQFIRVGRNLERADMSSRLIDVAASILLSGREDLRRFDNTLWMTILRSSSAYQMYRQYVRRRVHGPDVINFLLTDPNFPRTVAYCLSEVDVALRELPRPEAALEALAGVTRLLVGVDMQDFGPDAIHELIDRIQIEIGVVHVAIKKTWLRPEEISQQQ
jgi:uncharacterized alpha-E superfamily protein